MFLLCSDSAENEAESRVVIEVHNSENSRTSLAEDLAAKFSASTWANELAVLLCFNLFYFVDFILMLSCVKRNEILVVF